MFVVYLWVEKKKKSGFISGWCSLCFELSGSPFLSCRVTASRSHEGSQLQSWQCGNWLSPSFSSALCNICIHFQVLSPSRYTSSRWWQPAKVTGTGKKESFLLWESLPSQEGTCASLLYLLLKSLIACLDLNQSFQRERNVNRLEQNRIQPRVTWDRGRYLNKTC